MLGIPNLVYQLEVAKNEAHQQMLLAKIIRFKQKTIARLFKRDWKAVRMTKELKMNLISISNLT